MKKRTLIPALLILLVLFCSCGGKAPAEEPSTPVSNPEITEPSKMKSMVYFASEDSMYLIPEEREIEYLKEEEIPMKLISLLIEGPVTENLHPAINKSTEIKDIKIEHNTAKVTVGDNFIPLNTGGSTKEFMALYSITDTLCELEEVKEVSFFNSDGTPIEEFGSYIIDLPLIKDITIGD